MLALIQRVDNASVLIDNKITASISKGLLIFCGFELNDNFDTATKLLERCFNYRIFSDQNDKMNMSLRDIEGEALIVPQFTLVADTQSGLRPSFSKGMPPIEGNKLFSQLIEKSTNSYNKQYFGSFGADMKINLCNDGPVTFLLTTK